MDAGPSESRAWDVSAQRTRLTAAVWFAMVAALSTFGTSTLKATRHLVACHSLTLKTWQRSYRVCALYGTGRCSVVITDTEEPTCLDHQCRGLFLTSMAPACWHLMQVEAAI